MQLTVAQKKTLSEEIAALKLQLQAKDKDLADQQKEIQELACLKHVVSSQKNEIESLERQVTKMRGVYNRYKGKAMKQQKRSAKALSITLSTKKALQLKCTQSSEKEGRAERRSARANDKKALSDEEWRRKYAALAKEKATLENCYNEFQVTHMDMEMQHEEQANYQACSIQGDAGLCQS